MRVLTSVRKRRKMAFVGNLLYLLLFTNPKV